MNMTKYLIRLFGGSYSLYLFFFEIISAAVLVSECDALSIVAGISRSRRSARSESGISSSPVFNGVGISTDVGDATRRILHASKDGDLERPVTFLDSDYDNDKTNANNDGDESNESKKGLGRNRWENLRPTIKKRLIEKGQAKAIANKKKREPAAEKKRRMMMKFKELQRDKKRNSRVKRPLGFDERAPLAAFSPGMEITGTVISLTRYGAYIDIGTECDGLLHISQITREFFVEHPRQVLTPGDEVTVRIRSLSCELKKMHLTMLDGTDAENSLIQKDKNNNGDGDYNTNSGTMLEEFELDDELWGEMTRVTDFGSYINVGAEVEAFLHFMDHPLWDDGMRPSEFMKRGQRVRVWVADLNLESKRVRVTGCRPQNLPGPKFEL